MPFDHPHVVRNQGELKGAGVCMGHEEIEGSIMIANSESRSGMYNMFFSRLMILQATPFPPLGGWLGDPDVLYQKNKTSPYPTL